MSTHSRNRIEVPNARALTRQGVERITTRQHPRVAEWVASLVWLGLIGTTAGLLVSALG